MDVEHGVRELVQQAGTNQSHEARETDKLNAARLELPCERGVVLISRRKVAMADDQRLDSGGPSPVYPGSIRPIRNDDGNPGPELTARTGIDERLQVAAAAGDQHAENAAWELTPNGVRPHFYVFRKSPLRLASGMRSTYEECFPWRAPADVPLVAA